MSLHKQIEEHEAAIATLRRAIRIELIREWLAQRELTVWDNVLYITSEGQFRARITKISIEQNG